MVCSTPPNRHGSWTALSSQAQSTRASSSACRPGAVSRSEGCESSPPQLAGSFALGCATAWGQFSAARSSTLRVRHLRAQAAKSANVSVLRSVSGSWKHGSEIAKRRTSPRAQARTRTW